VSEPAADTTTDDAVAPSGEVLDDLAAAPAPEPEGPEVVDGGSGTDDDLIRETDKVSLDQALADFAVANSRVLDLAHRLTELTEEVHRLQDENARLRIRAARLANIEQSTAFQAMRAARAGGEIGRRALSRLRRG
jgi:hypothetical protein